MPSIEMAKKIADAFEVSLDFLVGEGKNASFDKKMIQRLDDITGFSKEEQEHILFALDAMITKIKLKAIT